MFDFSFWHLWFIFEIRILFEIQICILINIDIMVV